MSFLQIGLLGHEPEVWEAYDEREKIVEKLNELISDMKKKVREYLLMASHELLDFPGASRLAFRYSMLRSLKEAAKGSLGEWGYSRESEQTGFHLWWGGFRLTDQETDGKRLAQLQELHELQLDRLDHAGYLGGLEEVERLKKRLDAAQEALVREVEIFRLSQELNGDCDYCQDGLR